MSELETKITELERELALKKGYQAVKFVLPKSTPDDVAEEIQKILREIADGLAVSKEQLAGSGSMAPAHFPFSNDEVLVLKMLISAVESKTNGSSSNGAGASSMPTPPTAQDHVAKFHGEPRKAKILTAENVRGEARKYAAPDDEIYVPNPEKMDDHGMVSATHMKRGAMMKIPVDDIEWL